MRILIIRPGAIGDTLLALPVIRALRERYAYPHITFVGNAAVLPLVLASGLVEAVSDYEAIRWSVLFSVGSLYLAPMPFDLAICWLRDSDGLVERNLRAAGVQQVITAPGRPPEGERVHIVDYLAQTVGASMGNGQVALITAPGYQSNLPPLYDVAIHPGSGGARKCWPVSSFAAVIQRLRERACRVLLLGGPADHERIDALRHMLTCTPAMLLDAPLLEVARYLCRCRSYLGNDAGITHLAALLGVPTTALFSASDPAVWHPVGPSVTIIHAPRWEEITVEQVVENVLSSLM
ncbi:MAG: glycosyltransferase family 9 protein [Ktedonobacteraceae bacterium]